MRYAPFIPVVLALVIAIGCGTSDTEDKPVTPAVNQPAATTPASTTTTPAGQPIPGQNIQTLPASNVPVPTVNPVTSPAGQAGLNPEHGKPGHRCDIAVGAPLSSAPASATPAAANANAQPVVINQQPKAVTIPQPAAGQKNPIVINPPAAAGGAGLNPEHGKPGHRCDIAVGAPLSSAAPAAKPAIATAPQPVVKQTPTTLTTPPVVPAAGGAGLNPEHGKPGHRCDLAVGAPLNSKPAQ